MREDRTVQASIFDLFAKHEIGCELKKASTWLDEHPALIGLAAADLRRDGVARPVETLEPLATRLGLTIEAGFRTTEVNRLARHMRDAPGAGRIALISWRQRGPARWEPNRYCRSRPAANGVAGMSERHFRRLRDAYEADGAEGIVNR